MVFNSFMSLIYNHFFQKAIGLSKFFAFLSNFFLGFVTFLSQKFTLFQTNNPEICRFWLKFATFRDRFRWCIYTKILDKWGTFFKKSIPTWNNSVIFATISKHFRNITVRFNVKDRGWRHPKTAKSPVKPSLHWLFLRHKELLRSRFQARITQFEHFLFGKARILDDFLDRFTIRKHA